MTGILQIRRARSEDGFMLIELMIAMVVLTVGILALVAAYSSGYNALNRATKVSSATLIGDSQMERFRARQYSAIALNTGCAACGVDSTYTSDSLYNSSTQVTGCATTDVSCIPSQTVTGPDGKSYRLDTYVNYACPTGSLSGTPPSVTCSTGVTPVKQVAVVVRNSVGGTWLRERSFFTSITGS